LGDFISVLVDHPDEAFIHENCRVALVFDTPRNVILYLEGNFQGLKADVAKAVKNAIDQQHPIAV
jgi:hypothetical protein